MSATIHRFPAPSASSSKITPKRVFPWALARRQWLPSFIAKPIFGKPLAPSSAEWSHIQSALMQGDEPMDKVIEWMFAGNVRERKAQFEQALTQGIQCLEHPSAELVQFFALIDAIPEWLDETQLRLAVRTAHLTGMIGYYVLRDMALMGGYAYFNSMNQTLARAGALHADTGARLGETGKWLQDVSEENGLTRFGEGFITTIRVRFVHALIRRHLQSREDWSNNDWGIPINQVDMTATYLAFGPVSLTGSRLFGFMPTRRESAATLHLWRYVGWLSGVHPAFLAQTEGDGLRKLYHTFLTHRLPDEKVRLLGRSLMQEPLSRPVADEAMHPLKAKLKRFYWYQQHLSNSSLILDPVQRYRLGIPWYAAPWAPLLSFPVNFVKFGWARLRGEAALEALAARHREGQKRLAGSYFIDQKADIIQPKADHPAHIG